MKPRLLMALAAFVLLGCPSPEARPGEPAPPAEPPSAALDPAERAALTDALQSLNWSVADLGFKKNAPACDFVPPAVRRALSDPLSLPAAADETAKGISAGAPSDALIALAGLVAPGIAKPAPPPLEVPVDAAGWKRLFAPLLYDTEGMDPFWANLVGEPPPWQKMLADLALTLPVAEAEVAKAFAALSEDDRECLRQFGLLLAIAEDDRREGFEPPDPAKAEALRAKSPGKAPFDLLLRASEKVDLAALARAGVLMSDLADRIAGYLAGTSWDSSRPLREKELLRIYTRLGYIRVYPSSNDAIEEDTSFLIDLGGDDVYRGKAIGAASGVAGRPLALHVDLGGNDTYESSAPVSLGAAFLGASAFRDCAGKDTYKGGDVCLGAAIYGATTFVDASGDDECRANAFCMGAASFGVALLRDEAGKDLYSATVFAQGFARTMGAAALHDRGGNDEYRAGGGPVYLPQYKDRHFCHSQGFAIGVREHGAAGGVGVLLDEDGDDAYSGEVHCQGSSCWFSLGILCDRSGRDRYTAAFNAQGSAVHNAAGILSDGGGNDAYVLEDALGQGGAHDYAVGVLHDLAGDDEYRCRAAGQGVGLTNGVGILVDRSGKDTYVAREGHAQGAARFTREHLSVGLLADLAGEDRYEGPRQGPHRNGPAEGLRWSAWKEAAPAPKNYYMRDPFGIPPVPALPSDYPYTAEKWAEVFGRATLWVVGENRPVIAAAKAEILAWGEKALPFLEPEMKKWGMLHFWGLDDLVCRFSPSFPEATKAMVLRCLAGQDSVSRVNAIRLAGKLEIAEAGPAIVALLNDPNWKPYTIWPAGQLRLREAVPVLVETVKAGKPPELVFEAVVALGKIADPSSLDVVLAALSNPDPSVAEAALRAAAGFGGPAMEPLARMAETASLPVTVRGRALRALPRSYTDPGDAALLDRTAKFLDAFEWPLRAGAARRLAGFPVALKDRAFEALRKRLAAEDHPFVRHCLVLAAAVLRQEAIWDLPLRSGVVEYPDFLWD